MPPETSEGGRVFFSNTKRMMTEEDELRLLSIGVDIGSATSHLVFSRIVLERFDSRYVVVSREVVYQSPILLTPIPRRADRRRQAQRVLRRRLRLRQPDP